MSKFHLLDIPCGFFVETTWHPAGYMASVSKRQPRSGEESAAVFVSPVVVYYYHGFLKQLCFFVFKIHVLKLTATAPAKCRSGPKGN